MRVLIILLVLISPLTTLLGQEEGYASWYGGKFNGRLTANGEVYDMEKLTAAHRTLPFDTMVRIINLQNDKTTIVRINDRGPFVEGRIIDLSRAAAEEIDIVGTGIAYVKLEILTAEHPAAADLRYTIQVASYKEKENAYQARELLEAENLEVTFEQTETGYIRVYVINITQAEVEATEKILEGLNFKGWLIRKQ